MILLQAESRMKIVMYGSRATYPTLARSMPVCVCVCVCVAHNPHPHTFTRCKAQCFERKKRRRDYFNRTRSEQPVHLSKTPCTNVPNDVKYFGSHIRVT